MLKNPYIKLSFIVVGLFIALGVAYAKFEVIKLSGYPSAAKSLINSDDHLEARPSNNDIDEAKSPAYFSIFKFISNFAPGKK